LNTLREMLREEKEQDLEGFSGERVAKKKRMTVAAVAESVQTAIDCTTSGAVGVVAQAIIDAITEVCTLLSFTIRLHIRG
jgi:hypothetical protein